MSPALAAAIDAARDLAWRPTSNLGGRTAHLYRERYEAHERVLAELTYVRDLSAHAEPELRYLLAAIRRVAAASFANRAGAPYYERKQAVIELRGCLDVYDRSLRAAA